MAIFHVKSILIISSHEDRLTLSLNQEYILTSYKQLASINLSRLRQKHSTAPEKRAKMKGEMSLTVGLR